MDHRMAQTLAAIESTSAALAISTAGNEVFRLALRRLDEALCRFDAGIPCAALDEIERQDRADRSLSTP